MAMISAESTQLVCGRNEVAAAMELPLPSRAKAPVAPDRVSYWKVVSTLILMTFFFEKGGLPLATAWEHAGILLKSLKVSQSHKGITAR